MDFSEKAQEVTTHSENILNLPYSDSEEEQEEGADLAFQVVEEIQELPSPTPKEQDEPVEKASSSKPKTQKINQFLRKVYETEVLVREVKRNNATLTSRNKLLHKSYLELRERYAFLKGLNKRYLKNNIRLYRMISLQRLQIKEAKLNLSTHLTLETLVEVVVSLKPLEASQASLNRPNIEPVEEES